MNQFERFIPNRAVQVRCLTCSGLIERLEWEPPCMGFGEWTPTKLRVFCHGATEEIEYPEPVLHRGTVHLEAFKPPEMVPDGIGGASSDGSCSCGTAGCRSDARKKGCPRYCEE